MILNAKTEYASIAEELEATREMMARQQQKFQNASNEIQDLQHEHQNEKEDTLMQLRQ
jgi:hypothetical protein